jgi:uncharacterized membrane protein YfhO
MNNDKDKIFGKEEIKSFVDNRKYYIHINKNALPRAYTMNDMVFASDEEQLHQLVSGDLSEAVYVFSRKDLKNKQRNIKAVYSFEELQKKNHIENVDYSNPNKITLDVDTAVSSMLVFSEVWHPGWKAVVDGVSKKVYRVNYCQRGVWLDKGKHQVKLVFKPNAWFVGRNVTVGTLFFMLITIIFSSVRGKGKKFSFTQFLDKGKDEKK